MPRIRKYLITAKQRQIARDRTNFRPTQRRKPLKQFITERLGQAEPLTKNGRIKVEFRTAADEICYRLMQDARRGNFQAIKLLVECTEGRIIHQDAMNHIVDRVYDAVSTIVKDEEQLFEIGKAFHKIKHTYQTGCHIGKRAIVEPYTDPSQLDPSYHQVPEIRARLLDHQSTREERRALLNLPAKASKSKPKAKP